jgi:hypothetical protein
VNRTTDRCSLEKSTSWSAVGNVSPTDPATNILRPTRPADLCREGEANDRFRPRFRTYVHVSELTLTLFALAVLPSHVDSLADLLDKRILRHELGCARRFRFAVRNG